MNIYRNWLALLPVVDTLLISKYKVIRDSASGSSAPISEIHNLCSEQGVRGVSRPFFFLFFSFPESVDAISSHSSLFILSDLAIKSSRVTKYFWCSFSSVCAFPLSRPTSRSRKYNKKQVNHWQDQENVLIYLFNLFVCDSFQDWLPLSTVSRWEHNEQLGT